MLSIFELSQLVSAVYSNDRFVTTSKIRAHQSEMACICWKCACSQSPEILDSLNENFSGKPNFGDKPYSEDLGIK